MYGRKLAQQKRFFEYKILVDYWALRQREGALPNNIYHS